MDSRPASRDPFARTYQVRFLTLQRNKAQVFKEKYGSTHASVIYNFD